MSINVTELVTSALFVYEPDADYLIETAKEQALSCALTELTFEHFVADPDSHLAGIDHVVIAGSVAAIKQVLKLSMNDRFSVGVVPMKGQDRLRRYMDLPEQDKDAIEWALQADPKASDIALCNGDIMLFRAIIGWLPVLDSSDELSRLGILKRVFNRSLRLSLYPYRFLTGNEKKIDTAATGCMIVQRHEGDMVSRLLRKETSVRDGKVGVVVASPFSMMEYLKLLYQLLFPSRRTSSLPRAVAYLESRSFKIDSDKTKDVYIDGELATQTPVSVQTLPGAIRLNYGPSLIEADAGGESDKEIIRTDNLRTEKELVRSIGTRVPFFSYASEDRFRDLFTALNDDATINTNYIVFMLLSTLLASLGLFLNSAAVIIGAMILAPLMSPMVAVSMALLRGNDKLLWPSLEKLGLGVLLALATAALVSAAFPYKPITAEMMGRLNPSLPDLFVAIFSGVAAAYARSFKEIAQSLAGVAIAVALVPPLSVAGIGLGRGDFSFFLQAFLLFSTNLVGIIVAATLTFRVLGFSPTLRIKHGLGFVVVLLLLVAVPLGISSGQIADRWKVEESLENKQFLINGKEISITDLSLGGGDIFTANVLVDSPLSDEDLVILRELIHAELEGSFNIELDVHFRL